MEKENLKITAYEDGVANLPDYPSDAGYTAEMLKSVFDARSNKEIKEKHNALCDATAEIFESLKEHCEDKENPHGVTKEQIGADGVRVVSSTDDLSLIIPEKDEVYFIKYENLRHKDGDGNIKTSEKAIYTMKTGDGVTSLALLPTMQNIVPSEGEGSLAQFVEEEAEGYMNGGIFYLPASFAEGYAAVALGRYNKAIGNNSMAVNYNNEVAARDAFAANSGNSIAEEAEGAFVAGHCNEVKNPYQVVFGTYSDVGENDAFVIGNGENGKKRNAFRVDKQGHAFVSGTLVANNINANNGLQVNGESRICNSVFGSEGSEGYGTRSTVTGIGSVAFNRNNKVGGKHCFAALSSNTIPEGLESVFIAGHANTAAASHQAIFGTYAVPETNDALVIGNGTSAGRKNAFAVEKSGNIRIGGTQIKLGNTAITETILKKLWEIDGLKAKITELETRLSGESE